MPYVCCTRVSYPMVSPDTSYVELPFFQHSSPTTAHFIARATLTWLPLQSGMLWVRPDDCVEKIIVNGNPVDDAVINNQPHCSDVNIDVVVSADIAPYLHPGQNDVEIDFLDKGGEYGFDMGVAHTSTIRLLTLCLLAVSGYYGWRAFATTTLPPKLRALLRPRETVAGPDAPVSRIQRATISFGILLLSFLYLYPITSTHQWFASHTRIDYLYEMDLFRSAFASGIWYPRWLPGLQGGYGYPTFLFIAPGLFFLTLPFTWVISNLVYCLYASLFLLTCAGGFGAYRLARLYCRPDAAFTCVTLFMTTHYAGVNLFERGDITEYGAMMLCPWLLYYFIRLADGIHADRLETGTVAGFTLSLLAILLMHPLVFLYCAIPGALLMLGKWAEGHYNPHLIVVTAACGIMAFVLGSPYWWTAMQMKDFIHQGGMFITSSAKSLSDFTHGFFDPGLLQAGLAGLGFICAWRTPFFRYVAAAWLLLLLLLTDYTHAVWHWDTPMKYSQFPWRINSVLASVQLLGIIQLAGWLSGRLHQGLWPVLSAGIVLFSLYTPDWDSLSLHFREPFRIWGAINYEQYKHDWEQKEFIYAGVYREFFPATAHYDNLPNRLTTDVPVAESSNGKVTLASDSTPERPHFSIEFNHDDAPELSALINQMYFPGWQVAVDKQESLFTDDPVVHPNKAAWSIGDHGRIRIDFPHAGRFDVVAWYDGPPGWAMRNMLVALLVSVMLGIFYWQFREINGKARHEA